jgi:hypothetical protein
VGTQSGGWCCGGGIENYPGTLRTSFAEIRTPIIWFL